MSTSPPEGGPDHGVETLYRRLAKLDPSEPAAATREAIMARAQELANSRSADVRHNRRGPRLRWSRSAMMGALAASIVIALVIAPRYLRPGSYNAGESQPQSPVPPAANQSLQLAPPAGPATDRQFAQGTAARPESAPPPAANGSRAASAPMNAAAAKSATPEGRGADVTASEAALGNAQQAMRAPNAAERSAFAARAPALVERPEQRLREAAEAGDVGKIATIAPGLTDLNARDAQGRTAVMIATLHGQMAAVTTLLSLGADPNVADANGLTPLKAAREAGAGGIVTVLERYGAH
jgi:hypothetical protein